jgi:molybdopterin converting factor subunit 1
MSIRVTVKLFARLREAVGTGRLEREVSAGTTLGDLLADLRVEFPALAEAAPRTIVALNRAFAAPDSLIRDGDEVALFPPVSGGSERLRITSAPISADEVIRSVVRPAVGAVASFVGTVRDISEGKAVAYLEYEAYPEMAVEMLQQVADEVRARWPDVIEVAMVQRIGRLEVGEIAVVIAISSSHRDQGCFEACRYAIDRLKQIVPVWKKEVGPDGAVWIEGEHLPGVGSAGAVRAVGETNDTWDASGHTGSD